ncbi:amino acid permease-domain-containing protein [Helicostylum pulchrum]|nr:amino acid permease-domain-containing protein [Helicostylum pulchrum]
MSMDEKTETKVVESATQEQKGTFFESVTARYTKVTPESYLRREGETKNRFLLRRLGQIKPVELLWGDAENSELKRALSAFQLVFVGIGAIIGTGIFVLSGLAAANNAGPAVTLSFVIAAIAAAFAALSYSEMASMIPVAGSAYTYAYATMGEFVAWTIGWDLILEYMVGAATVGVGWSGYFVKFFEVASGGKINLTSNWTEPTIKWVEVPAEMSLSGAYLNVPGFCIIMLITLILIVGIRQSAMFNTVVVTIKLVVILIFIFALSGFLDPANFSPYIPENTGDWHFFGVPGIFAAATTVFFSYIGFDAVTTAALEAKRPQRDLPIGILGSLVISTVLYLAFCTIMTGAANYTEFKGSPVPASVAVEAVMRRYQDKNFAWLNILVAIGAVCGLTSVLLINLLAQSRVFYAMAQDGLLPPMFAKIHPKFKTPHLATITVGTITAVMAAVLPVDFLGNMTSVGTLLAFFIVHLGVIVLRFTRPDIERRFKIPGGKYFSLVFPILGMCISVALIAVAEVTTIWRLFVWMALGWILYFAYGIHHSRFNRDPIGRFKEAERHLPAYTEQDDTGYQVQEYDYVPETHQADPNTHRI